MLYTIFITTPSSEPSCGLQTLPTCYNRASRCVRHAHKKNRRTSRTQYVLCTLAHLLTGTPSSVHENFFLTTLLCTSLREHPGAKLCYVRLMEANSTDHRSLHPAGLPARIG
jgi:hypothetical protein